MPIQPGFGFYKSLLAAKKFPLTKLRIKIPETILAEGNNIWISSTSKGIAIKKKFIISEFLMALES